jgi:hypothetical protein
MPMKDCAYTHSYKNEPCCPSPKDSEEERYPTFSVWDSEAITAIFGKTKLTAGAEFDITPIRVRVKKVTSDEKEGPSNVELAIVAVGPIKPASGRAMEDEEEENEEES